MNFIDSLSFILSIYPHTIEEIEDSYLIYLHTNPPISIHTSFQSIIDDDMIREALTDPDFLFVENCNYYIDITCYNKSYSNAFYTIGDLENFIHSTIAKIL